MFAHDNNIFDLIKNIREIYEDDSETNFEKFAPLTQDKPSCVLTCTNLDFLSSDEFNPENEKAIKQIIDIKSYLDPTREDKTEKLQVALLIEGKLKSNTSKIAD